MISNKLVPFIVEPGLNTSYIDALFVSMFFKPSYIQDMLIDQDNNIELDAIHLQDIIYHYFVRNMRSRYTINYQVINEIRNQLIFQGWMDNCNIVDLFEVQDLYNFLTEKFYRNGLINFESCDGSNLNLNYININVEKSDNIRDMVNLWIDENLQNYHLRDIPKFIPIFLNRNHRNDITNFLIDIKEGIQFEKNNNNQSQHEILWVIHSIICFSKTGNGHYYCIVSDGNEWFLFSDNKIPSLIKINIKDEDIVLRIKQECVFVFYTLDKKNKQLK